MKKAFETPLVELIRITDADILCTSVCAIPDPVNDNGTELT